VLVIIRMA